MTSTEAKAVLAKVTGYLRDAEIEYEQVGDDIAVAVLPGEHRLKTTVSISVGTYAVTFNAFVVRNPDENFQAVYRWLLERNRRIYAVSYAIDSLGDIYLVGKLPISAINPVELDRILGTILENSDGAFDYLLELGFETAIRREWKWRLSRGESTRNLEAFRHLAGDPTAGTTGVEKPED